MLIEKTEILNTSVISGLRREDDKNCALLGCYHCTLCNDLEEHNSLINKSLQQNDLFQCLLLSVVLSELPHEIGPKRYIPAAKGKE